MQWYIECRFYGNPTNTFYYTGLDGPSLQFSTDISDAETFNSFEDCFYIYKSLVEKLEREHNTKNYIFINSRDVE